METIYALKCPVTEKIRYVGRTRNKPEYRYASHCGRWAARRIRKWVKWLATFGKKPELIILATVDDSCADFEEKRYIHRYSLTVKLLNCPRTGPQT